MLMNRTGKKRDAPSASKRVRAEAALPKSEERFQDVCEKSGLAYFFIDMEGRFQGVNKAWLRLHKLDTADEILGRHYSTTQVEADQAAARQIVERLPTQKGITQGEFRRRCKDGSIGWHAFSVSPVRRAGKVIGIEGILIDTTERKRAEERLQEGEAKLRALFEGSVYAMGLAKDGIQIMVNPAYVELFGYSNASEVVGRPLFTNIAPEERPRLREFTRRRSLGEPVPSLYETRGVKRDGTVFEMAVGVSTYELNNEVYTIGILRDITQRKMAEKKVREQAALLDNANDAICVTALDGTILYWNRGSERTFGWTGAEMVNRKATELIRQDLVSMAAISAVLFNQGTWSGEWRHTTKGGGVVEVFSRLTLMRNEQGEAQSIFAISTDITEKKQIEAQFLRAQRLESIGALASGIAHDLNNVLTPILLGVPLLDAMVKDEKARHLLGTIQSSAQRGAGMVKQVLTFARGVEGDRLPLQLRHLVGEMTRFAAETFPKDIRVESDVAVDALPILGDATQLHQALLNLCINARDAMPGGGVLTLKAANVVLSEEEAEKIPGAQPGSFASLSVADTGAGIPPEIEAKIFEPFFTTKGQGKGTGLGLSTVLGIVHGHGGFVRHASKVGHGSTFELCIPATTTEQAAAKGASAAPWPRAHGECILVVDDEAAICEVARQALVEYGYQVITASRGAEALSIFEERRQGIQLVLTDMMMPEMDGPTLVAALRAVDRGVRIVGITGMSDTAGVNTMKALELSAMLRKPFTIERLLAVIRGALPVTPGSEGPAGSGPPSP